MLFFTCLCVTLICVIHWSYVLLFKLFPCKAFADCLSSLFPTLHFCSHLVPDTAMIVINVSFSLTITVFGLERALAKRTIVVFGEFWHVYFLHYIFYMYIMIMLPGMHVHLFPLYTVYVLLCTLQNKSACVFIGLLLDIWCCINILRSLLYARTLHKAWFVWLSMHIHPFFDYTSKQITLHLVMVSEFRFYLQHATWTSLILSYTIQY